MTEFHHHPDGIIYLRGDGEAYAATLDSFTADLASCGLPAYDGLPAGTRERRYLGAGAHFLYTADTQEDGGDWPAGDAYLAALTDLRVVAAQRGAT